MARERRETRLTGGGPTEHCCEDMVGPIRAASTIQQRSHLPSLGVFEPQTAHPASSDSCEVHVQVDTETAA